MKKAPQRTPRVPRTPPIHVPISPGELIDKITILKIKDRQFTDARKLRNVRRELAQLVAARDRAIQPSPKLKRLTARLLKINKALWDIELNIRCCDDAGDFGPRFIRLARSVYEQNDLRSEVKREINELLGSELMEEKGYKRRTKRKRK